MSPGFPSERILAVMLALTFVLAAATAPSPAATPQSALAPLKTIASVRATPFCGALRTNIAPAIAGVLEADHFIDGSVPLFGLMYRHDVIEHSSAMEFDVMHLESAITPLVKAEKQIQIALSDKAVFAHPKTGDDRRLVQMQQDLLAIAAEQNKALNIISGFVDTYQMGELQNEGLSPELESSLGITQGRYTPPFPSMSESPAATNLLTAGLKPGPEGRPVNQDPQYAGFGFDPFGPFPIGIMELRRAGDAQESAAALTITAAAAECSR